MRWTNDVYVSTPHCIVNRSARERYSIAFFYDPNPRAEVAVIPSCIGPGEPVRYPPVLAADYLKFRLDASKPEAVGGPPGAAASGAPLGGGLRADDA